jgi:hypothetical protein
LVDFAEELADGASRPQKSKRQVNGIKQFCLDWLSIIAFCAIMGCIYQMFIQPATKNIFN